MENTTNETHPNTNPQTKKKGFEFRKRDILIGLFLVLAVVLGVGIGILINYQMMQNQIDNYVLPQVSSTTSSESSASTTSSSDTTSSATTSSVASSASTSAAPAFTRQTKTATFPNGYVPGENITLTYEVDVPNGATATLTGAQNTNLLVKGPNYSLTFTFMPDGGGGMYGTTVPKVVEIANPNYNYKIFRENQGGEQYFVYHSALKLGAACAGINPTPSGCYNPGVGPVSPVCTPDVGSNAVLECDKIMATVKITTKL